MALTSGVSATSWGYHLIVNAGNCNPRAIRNPTLIKKFSKNLVSAIHMVAYGPPKLVMFGTGNKKGYTLVQLIETSNICAHFVENPDSGISTGDIYLDIFSCKNFNQFIARDIVDKYFEPQHMECKLITRQAPHHWTQLSRELK
jgi:S-adenosylmethionine/arginine decarboxylase-like enzyme